MKNTICFYDKHIICAYLDRPDDEINFYGCCTCPHCQHTTFDEPETSGRYKWGALILATILFIAFLLLVAALTKGLRP